MPEAHASPARLPVLFLGHGNPMNSLRDNAWTRAWAEIGQHLPQRPRAVLSVSAHWFVPETALTAMPQPPTIHDFGGFPRELFEVQYPAPGDPGLVRRVRELLAPTDARADDSWGLDHGTWSVLRHVFPKADIPVVQLSIDLRQPPAFHHALGQRLKPLRDEGVLIVGSGNVVHNLHAYVWKQQAAKPLDWALRFEATVRALITQGQQQTLVEYAKLGSDALMSIPTPDHYLPLLYVLGASDAGEAVSFPTDGIEGGSMSMLSARFG